MTIGGNSNRQISISSVFPYEQFEYFIHQYNGNIYGRSQLIFKGNLRISTKYPGGKCPYKFATWFFNNSKSVKSITKRKPAEWINIYNCNFTYSKISFRLKFTADVSWCYNIHAHRPIWQKLNDTT